MSLEETWRQMKALRFASIIVTFRCNARCHMCNTWKHPSDPAREVGLDVYEKLPAMGTVNVTGGEPFLREELPDIVQVLKQKANRVVISSNGYHTERILDLFRTHRDVGIRISIEGLPEANDQLRGLKGGFDHGIRTLVELGHMGVKDIGFGITVTDRNAKDLLELYHLAKMMKVEFATAAMHNAFYFHKYDNEFQRPDVVVAEFEKLIVELLQSRRAKDWFRAYFNHGLANFVRGGPRLLPCEMGHDSFFLDPYGEVLPCNVMDESMGSLKDSTFEGIWSSPRAEEVRRKAKTCGRNCWMIGSVSEPMKKHLHVPVRWILRNKLAAGGQMRRRTPRPSEER